MPRLLLILTIALLAPLHGEDMDLHARLAPVPSEAKFESKDYFIWSQNGRPKVLYCAATGQNEVLEWRQAGVEPVGFRFQRINMLGIDQVALRHGQFAAQIEQFLLNAFQHGLQRRW